MGAVVYKVNNPGFVMYPKESIFPGNETVIAPFTSVHPPQGAYLPWFDFHTQTWEETADSRWIELMQKEDTSKLTKEQVLDKVNNLKDEIDKLLDEVK